MNIKQEKARQLRYKKPIVKNLNLEQIQTDLWDMLEACGEVRYYTDEDNDALINALDGDEEEAYEFKMMFSDLYCDCEQMQYDLENEYVPECFDAFFVAIGAGEYGGGYLGWDSYEEDYFGIDCADRFVEDESGKRLMRLTKEQLIDAAHVCFKIMYAYLGLKDRYDSLKAAMDIIRDKNKGYLKVINRINELYEKANSDNFWYGDPSTNELDRLVKELPDTAWIS